MLEENMRTSITILLIVAFLGILPLMGDSKQEISADVAETLIQSRVHYAKDIRLCWEQSGGIVCNVIDMNDAGTLYVTEVGIVHRGKKTYLIRWQNIKRISIPVGKTDILRLWTTDVTEKITITDYKRTGSMTSLDTGLDTLFRVLKKNHRRNWKLSPKPLPRPLPKSAPAAAPSPQTPSTPATPPASTETVDIKTGMTPKEVEKKLGPPMKRIVLEKKTIYQYKDMVLTFIDGKLKDVSMK